MSDLTAQQVITAAYRKCGVKSLSTDELSDGLQDLQSMLSSWSVEGLSIPSFTEENFTLVVSQMVYTIGSGGDFDTVRPINIGNAFIRISGTDYKVETDMTKDQYNALSNKTTEGRPTRLYYDPQYSLGKIKFNYEADTAYDFHMVSEKPLTSPSTLATSFSIPQEANLAMIFNLAVIIAPDCDIQLPPEVHAIARSSKETLENYNSIDKFSDHVTLDSAIYGESGTRLDINSGGY